MKWCKLEVKEKRICELVRKKQTMHQLKKINQLFLGLFNRVFSVTGKTVNIS